MGFGGSRAGFCEGQGQGRFVIRVVISLWLGEVGWGWVGLGFLIRVVISLGWGWVMVFDGGQVSMYGSVSIAVRV